MGSSIFTLFSIISLTIGRRANVVLVDTGRAVALEDLPGKSSTPSSEKNNIRVHRPRLPKKWQPLNTVAHGVPRLLGVQRPLNTVAHGVPRLLGVQRPAVWWDVPALSRLNKSEVFRAAASQTFGVEDARAGTECSAKFGKTYFDLWRKSAIVYYDAATASTKTKKRSAIVPAGTVLRAVPEKSVPPASNSTTAQLQRRGPSSFICYNATGSENARAPCVAKRAVVRHTGGTFLFEQGYLSSDQPWVQFPPPAVAPIERVRVPFDPNRWPAWASGEKGAWLLELKGSAEAKQRALFLPVGAEFGGNIDGSEAAGPVSSEASVLSIDGPNETSAVSADPLRDVENTTSSVLSRQTSSKLEHLRPPCTWGLHKKALLVRPWASTNTYEWLGDWVNTIELTYLLGWEPGEVDVYLVGDKKFVDFMELTSDEQGSGLGNVEIWREVLPSNGTSEVITPRPITPTFGYTKETHPHSVGSWLHDVWSRRVLVVCRRDVSWEGGRGRPYYSSFASEWTSPGRVSGDVSRGTSVHSVHLLWTGQHFG